MALESLRIDDYSDREFLLVLDDLADGDGWADSQRVAEQLGFESRRFAAVRLSWLQRFGAVEREHERDEHGNIRYTVHGKLRYTQRWRMTEAGAALAHGRLRKRQAESLERIGEEQMIEVTRWLTRRARGSGAVAAKLIAREWRYGTSASRNGRVA
jgi:hypothetical protein